MVRGSVQAWQRCAVGLLGSPSAQAHTFALSLSPVCLNYLTGPVDGAAQTPQD